MRSATSRRSAISGFVKPSAIRLMTSASRSLRRDLACAAVLAGGHQRAESGVQVVAAGDRGAEGLQQLRRLGLLQHVAARTGTERLARVLGVLAHREDRHGQRGMRR